MHKLLCKCVKIFDPVVSAACHWDLFSIERPTKQYTQPKKSLSKACRLFSSVQNGCYQREQNLKCPYIAASRYIDFLFPNANWQLPKIWVQVLHYSNALNPLWTTDDLATRPRWTLRMRPGRGELCELCDQCRRSPRTLRPGRRNWWHLPHCSPRTLRPALPGRSELCSHTGARGKVFPYSRSIHETHLQLTYGNTYHVWISKSARTNWNTRSVMSNCYCYYIVRKGFVVFFFKVCEFCVTGCNLQWKR